MAKVAKFFCGACNTWLFEIEFYYLITVELWKWILTSVHLSTDYHDTHSKLPHALLLCFRSRSCYGGGEEWLKTDLFAVRLAQLIQFIHQWTLLRLPTAFLMGQLVERAQPYSIACRKFVATYAHPSHPWIMRVVTVLGGGRRWTPPCPFNLAQTPDNFGKCLQTIIFVIFLVGWWHQLWNLRYQQSRYNTVLTF